MKKLFLIGLKDLKLIFRDPAALVLMLAAPFALTLGLGFVTGQFGGSGSGIGNIPVVIVNQDSGQLGAALVEMFQSEQLSDLVTATQLDDPTEAFQQVDDDLVAAAILVPAGFTDSVLPPAGQSAPGRTIQLQVYANPTRPTSVGVIKTILEEFVNRLEVARVGGTVAITQLIESGLVPPQEAAALAVELGQQQADSLAESNAITLTSNVASEAAVNFNPLAYIAPGMALMFLMYTASNAGRTLLLERDHGTLPRLLISPTASAQVLGGKIFGVYLSGVAQMLILIIASTLLFQLQWGDPLGVLALVLAAVFGATGWGMVITALAKRPGQVAAVGSVIMLTFGILGGSFINLEVMPVWVQFASKITPNAWGLDGFSTLALGGGLNLLGRPILALIVMGLALFAVALVFFNRRGMAMK
ncbi:MAG: ABC transporter permease [Anaerolineales bacterium]|nr:ABC transporter permease [Anaerolineales bacterium]